MSNANINMREMLEAGVHFGHQVRYWNPKMKQYIFGVRHKVHIINLDKTLPLYLEAVNFMSSIVSKKGKILFVGTKRAAQKIISEEAERCGMPYVDNRWLGGMLTNYKTVRQSIRYFKEMEAKRDSGETAKLSKKEALFFMRELSKLERNLKGIKNMGGLPDAIFIVDVGHEKIAVNEANKLRIPVIGIVDTNRNPDNIDYVIPANDDSESAIRLYAKYIADAIIEAKSLLPKEEMAIEKDSKKVIKKNSKVRRNPRQRDTNQGDREGSSFHKRGENQSGAPRKSVKSDVASPEPQASSKDELPDQAENSENVEQS